MYYARKMMEAKFVENCRVLENVQPIRLKSYVSDKFNLYLLYTLD